MKESSDVARARADVDAVEAQRAELEDELKEQIAALSAESSLAGESLTRRVLRPRGKPEVRALVLAWIPYRDGARVVRERA